MVRFKSIRSFLDVCSAMNARPKNEGDERIVEWAELGYHEIPEENHADVLMSLAETLGNAGCSDEAMHFADQAIEQLLPNLNSTESDEVAEFLRRYGKVASIAGLLPTAQFAYTLGLILLQDINGIESEIADEAFDNGINFGFGALGKLGRAINEVSRSV